MAPGTLFPSDFKGTGWSATNSFLTSIDTEKNVFKITMSGLKATKPGAKNLTLQFFLTFSLKGTGFATTMDTKDFRCYS